VRVSLPADDISGVRGESVCGQCAGEEFVGGGEYPILRTFVWQFGSWAGKLAVGVLDECVCGGIVGIVVLWGEIEGEVEVFGEVRLGIAGRW